MPNRLTMGKCSFWLYRQCVLDLAFQNSPLYNPHNVRLTAAVPAVKFNIVLSIIL